MDYQAAENGEYIYPQAVRYQADRMKEETTIMKERRLNAEEDKASRGPETPAKKP